MTKNSILFILLILANFGNLFSNPNHIGDIEKVSHTLKNVLLDEKKEIGTFPVSNIEDGVNEGLVYPTKITIIPPNGGETFTIGSFQTISWSDEGVDYFDGWYSTNNGSSWTSIPGFYQHPKNSFTWNIPLAISKNCKIKIADSFTYSTVDMSDNTFSIVNQNSVFDNSSDSEPVYNKFITEDKISINCTSKNENSTISLQDILGNEINREDYQISISSGNVTIYLGSLPRGLYSFIFEDGIYLIYKI